MIFCYSIAYLLLGFVVLTLACEFIASTPPARYIYPVAFLLCVFLGAGMLLTAGFSLPDRNQTTYRLCIARDVLGRRHVFDSEDQIKSFCPICIKACL